MLRIGKLLAGLVALLVTGCSTAAPVPEATEPDTGVGEPDPVAAEAPSDQIPGEPLGDLVELVEQTMATPHRYEVFLELPDGNTDIDPGQPLQLGAFDGTWLAVDTFLGPLEPGASSDPVMQAITGDGTGYFSLPGWRSFDADARDQMLRGNPLAPAVDSWVVMDLVQVQDRTGLSALVLTPSIADIAGNLTELMMAVVDVEEGPASSIRGTATRGFVARIPADPDNVFEPDDISVSFEVDAQGYVRSVTSDSSFGLNRIEIFDIDSVATIELPPTAIDITESSIELLTQQLNVGQPPIATTSPDARPTATPNVPQEPTLLDQIAFQPELSIFLSLLVESGIDSAIDGSVNTARTVLAPTNFALEGMGEELVRIRNDESLLVEFVSAHILDGGYTLSELTALNESLVGTISGPDGSGWVTGIALDEQGELIVGSGSRVLVGDARAANGLLHIIDRPVR